jgi:hypothetical protein
MMTAPIKQGTKQFKWAFILSSTSMVGGIFREFLIVFLFGFTAKNDHLQLYLSIFYTIGLSIDAIRLSCLNLFPLLSLPKMIIAASLIVLPFSLIIAFFLSYTTGGLSLVLLTMTILGSYFSLMAVLLITYKQRNNGFLLAQVIHILPNFILIPGIIVCYIFFPIYLIPFIICLTSCIPLLQFLLLWYLPSEIKQINPDNEISIITALGILLRHFSAGLGEQAFQIVIRVAFFTYATGYLSMYAFGIRIYAAARFVLIDSYIVSKLSNWQYEKNFIDTVLSKLVNLTFFNVSIVIMMFIISILSINNLFLVLFQMLSILGVGFYFSTLVRVSYFKINHYIAHSSLVSQFAVFEFLAALLAYLFTKQSHYPIFVLLWIGYIAKYFFQLLILRKKYTDLSYMVRST